MPASPPPSERPRSVEVAFGLWLAAALLLVYFGLRIAFASGVPWYYHGAGGVCVAAGIALGLLSGQARRRRNAYRRAAMGLSLALVPVLVPLTILTFGFIWPLILSLALLGALVINQPPVQPWFDTEGRK
jgi:hypothetical protein